MGVGVFATAWVSHWVADHWQGARPAVVFLVLRWLVAALAGLSIASLFQLWGEKTGEAVQDGPLGGLDRFVGGAVGMLIGLIVAIALTLVAMRAPGAGFARVAAAQGRTAPVLIRWGEQASARGEAFLPGGRWLHQQFSGAARGLPAPALFPKSTAH